MQRVQQYLQRVLGWQLDVVLTLDNGRDWLLDCWCPGTLTPAASSRMVASTAARSMLHKHKHRHRHKHKHRHRHRHRHRTLMLCFNGMQCSAISWQAPNAVQ